MNLFFLSILFIPAQRGDLELNFSHLQLPLHGTIHKRTLYGFFERKSWGLDAIPLDHPPKERFNQNYLNIFREVEPPGPAPNAGWKFYTVAWALGPVSYNYRHHIKYNSIWISTNHGALSRMKFDELQLYDATNKDALSQYTTKYPNQDKSTPHEMYTNLLFKKYDKIFGDREGMSALRLGFAKDVAGFGSVPTSDHSCKCCIINKPKRRVEVWDTVFQWDPKKWWTTIEDGKNLETFDSLFAEYFYFFVREKDYYFVTESGKFFHAPPPKADEKSRTMKALWADAKGPIIAVIEDADRDKVWLFAKDKNPGAKRDLYFEMKEPIRTESFDPAKLRPVNIEGRGKLLLEYVPLILPDAKK
jgi:hypothetical protein